MQIDCGLEIEFYLKEDLCQLLVAGGFDFVILHPIATSIDSLVVKRDSTIPGGWEINIPPKYQFLEELCNLLKDRAYFTDKCAMHIHYDATKVDLERTFDRYVFNESDIIAEAKSKGVYASLNSPAIYGRRRCNLNVYKAYYRHKTIEHRIYKATFDYSTIIWCVEQLKPIIVYKE